MVHSTKFAEIETLKGAIEGGYPHVFVGYLGTPLPNSVLAIRETEKCNHDFK